MSHAQLKVEQYCAQISNAEDCVRVCAFAREKECARAHAFVCACDTQDMRGSMGLIMQHGQEKASDVAQVQ